ncbi:MAG TPA: hypothetical protein VF875_18570 [Anaeromyxobacter sp.]
MRATLLVLFAAALAACGSPQDRGSCGTSTDCPAGAYCAHTPDGSVCWPDAVAPVVSGVTVTCAAPCLRDSTLHVQATISDDAEVLDARVTLDVGGPPVPLARTGSTWSATLPLRAFPFDFFSHGVVATVTARDGARNETSLDASGVTTVTRLRWQTQFTSSVAPLAVNAAGMLAVPSSNGTTSLLTWDGEIVTSVQTGSNLQQPAAALASGQSFWVANDAGFVNELSDNGSGWTAVQKASTGDALRGSLALMSNGTVIAVSDAGVVYAVTAVTKNSSPLSGFTVGAIIDASDSIFAVAGGSAYRLSLSGGIPITTWTSPVGLGGTVLDPIACTTALVSVANTVGGGLLRSVSPGGDPELGVSTSTPAGGPVYVSDSSILVPEQTKTLSRWTSTGDAFPGWLKPDLGGAARTPLVMTGAAPFVVPTAKGAVHALRANGSIAWSGQLSTGTAALQPGNLFTYDATPGEELSLAYFAGSDGWLHAVIVDGKLDGSAPWPKAFHDPANTNRAGAQPW